MSPIEIDAEQTPEAPCMLSHSFGVRNMKLGAEAEFRSFIKTQSVTEQDDGFGRRRLEHRAGLVVMSVKNTNGLCSLLYNEFEFVSQPLESPWFSMYPRHVRPAASKRSKRLACDDGWHG